MQVLVLALNGAHALAVMGDCGLLALLVEAS
jgi:hypothetical protein